MIFKAVLKDTLKKYEPNVYFMERDFVFDIQRKIRTSVVGKGRKSNFYVLHGHGFKTDKFTGRKNLDIAIISIDELGKEMIELAVEFKFEPDVSRKFKSSKNLNITQDIYHTKFRTTDWDKIMQDIKRIRTFNKEGKEKSTNSIGIFCLIDEGGYYLKNHYFKNEKDPPPPGARWFKRICKGGPYILVYPSRDFKDWKKCCDIIAVSKQDVCNLPKKV